MVFQQFDGARAADDYETFIDGFARRQGLADSIYAARESIRGSLTKLIQMVPHSLE